VGETFPPLWPPCWFYYERVCVCISSFNKCHLAREHYLWKKYRLALREVHKLGWFTKLLWYATLSLSLYCAGEKYYRGEGLWGLDVQMVEAGGRSAVWDEWNGMDARCGAHMGVMWVVAAASPTLNKCAPAAVSLTQMSKQKALSARILTHREQRARRQADPFFFALSLYQFCSVWVVNLRARGRGK
jgi:hypothetical protein